MSDKPKKMSDKDLQEEGYQTEDGQRYYRQTPDMILGQDLTVDTSGTANRSPSDMQADSMKTMREQPIVQHQLAVSAEESAELYPEEQSH